MSQNHSKPMRGMPNKTEARTRTRAVDTNCLGSWAQQSYLGAHDHQSHWFNECIVWRRTIQPRHVLYTLDPEHTVAESKLLWPCQQRTTSTERLHDSTQAIHAAPSIQARLCSLGIRNMIVNFATLVQKEDLIFTQFWPKITKFSKIRPRTQNTHPSFQTPTPNLPTYYLNTYMNT